MTGLIHKPETLVGERYLVKKFLDEGGMQEVYVAFDNVLQKAVALKAPKNSSAKKRFKESAVLSAKVNHACVGKTLDYFSTEDRSYLIEELIIGEDLAKVGRRFINGIDPYLSAWIFHRLAKGIAASHHANVVHRDLKPSNIMLVGGIAFGELKITDFGIAQMAEAEIQEAVGDDGINNTTSKTVLGAIPYMAPEVISDGVQNSRASDIWAFGAIMYEVMSGKKPFGNGLKAVPSIMVAKPPQRPQQIDRPQFQSLGNQLYQLIISCLTLDPLLRPSADALVEQCANLCYTWMPRRTGRIKKYLHANYGFIEPFDDGEDVFFHVESIYRNGPKPAVDDFVCFGHYRGVPRDRAFPICVISKDQF